jgi:hypothetical protein
MPTLTSNPPPFGDARNTEDNNPKPRKQSEETLKKDEIIYNALTLGWKIVELKSRIQIARVEPKHFCLRLVSIWRALFNKIAVLHIKTFPESATAKTLYEPPSKEALPYLYPPEPDYANVGISDRGFDGLPVLENFKLYEVTRRAINCLTILYIDKEESLIPDTIEAYQNDLINQILKAAIDPGAGGGNLNSDEGCLQLEEGEVHAHKPVAEKDKPRQKAISILTERTVKFLTAWDGYLRENYYMSGCIPNDDAELIAYEAGRAMSLLSWGVTINTVPLELKVAKSPEGLKDEFIKGWTSVFREEAIIRLQHQINALSSALDDAYYQKHPEVNRVSDDDVLIVPDPDKPCHVINSVKQSIEYWRRTVSWICAVEVGENKNGIEGFDIVQLSKPLRLSLIEQADIWQTLMTGQQSLRAYKMETVTHKLMQDLTEEIQRKLHTDFKGSITQAEQVMKEMTTEVKGAIAIAGNVAKTGIEVMYDSFKGVFWIIGGVLAVGAILFILYMLQGIRHDFFVGASGTTGLLGIVSAIVGYFNVGKIKAKQKNNIDEGGKLAQEKVEAKEKAGKEKVENEGTNDGSVLSRIQGVANDTGKAILDGVERAYKQIKIELTGLKFSAAVSYPLVEFFVMKCNIKNDEVFLTKVIWSGKDRSEEVKRIASAAFGSLAIFISAPSSEETSVADAGE